MANFNKVILAGNLTRDPQLSHLPSNTPVVEFGLAVNRTWRDRQTGENREETCFVDCRAYGRQAETFNQYMSKGRPVLIEGRLQYQSWTANDGSKKSRIMVITENFQFLGSRDGGSGGRSASGAGKAGFDDGAPAEVASNDGPPPPSDDDIPF